MAMSLTPTQDLLATEGKSPYASISSSHCSVKWFEIFLRFFGVPGILEFAAEALLARSLFFFFFL
jgi:hypothetical protein